MRFATSSLRAAAAALVIGAASVASADVIVFNDFEGAAPATNNYGFRAPNFSGSTDDNLNGFGATITPNIQRATDAFPAGNANAGTRVGETQFQFIDTANTRWLRHTTSGATGVPNPVIDLTQPLNFDIYSTTPVRVSLLVRELATAPAGGIGSNGGGTGSIEHVGATAIRGTSGGATNAGPEGRLLTPNTWTTLTFDLPNEPVFAFTGNNDLTGQWGVLEALSFTSEGDAGPITVYYDNFSQGVIPEPATLGLLGLCGLGLLARRRA